MPRIITALLLALTLAPAAACDEPDDKDTVKRETNGNPDDFAIPDDGDTDTDTDTDGDDDGDDKGPPGCLGALPPTDGPGGTFGDKC